MIKKNRKSSALLLSISVLSIIFLMGLLASFNSSQELDQTSQAVYRAMCLQLAEAACEEASGILVQEKANVSWRVGIYEIAATSDFGKMGSRSKVPYSNPFVGGEIKDQCKATYDLCENFAGHYGKFSLDTVQVTLRQIQPIAYAPAYMNQANYYRPKDRGFLAQGGRPFVTEPEKHRDWQGQFEIHARVSFRGIRSRATIIKDLKIVNVAPIARQYTLFSIFGPSNEWDLKNDLNSGGILTLNNNKKKQGEARLAKFSDDRARVYLKGPYEIAIEADTPYSLSKLEKEPDNSTVYDVESPFGYKGWSLMPEKNRSLWDWNGTGHIPIEANKNIFFDIFKGIWKGGEKYYRGSVPIQKFRPSHKNLLGRPRGPSNGDDAHYDNDENSYTLEHYWDPDNKSVEKDHRIMGVYKRAVIWPGTITFPEKKHYQEFRFSRIKSSFWKDLINGLKRVIIIWSPTSTFLGNIWNWAKGLIGGKGFDLSKVDIKNALPTNYKDFRPAAVRVVKDISWLYDRDNPETSSDDESLYHAPDGATDGTFHLPVNGVYWVSEDCTIDKPTTYSGKGMIISVNTKKKMTISSSILEPLGPPSGDTLTLIYHPQKKSGGHISNGNINTDQLYLKGKNLILKNVSLFSMYGLKTDTGSSHLLEGNLVNWFMKKSKQKGDLIIDYPIPSKFSLFREEDNNDTFLKALDYASNVSPVVSFYFAR